MNTHCFQLIYASKCADDMSENDLVRILFDASKGNARVGVSGLLVHKQGQFLQLLEGTKASVIEIFDKIEKDNRHESVDVLHVWDKGEKIASSFMEFRSASSTIGTQYHFFFNEEFNFSSLKQHAVTARNFLRTIAAADKRPEQNPQKPDFQKETLKQISDILHSKDEHPK